MGQVHLLGDDIELNSLGLDPKELATFVGLLSRVIKSSSEVKEGPRRVPQHDLTMIAERMYRVRRLRESVMAARFGSDIFSDPAWDIILDLYIHNSRNQDVSVTSVCAASMVPITTALRYITVLSERGLIERTRNPKDGRSYLLRLSAAGLQAIEDFLSNVHTGPDNTASNAAA